jgi:hypothetical protein
MIQKDDQWKTFFSLASAWIAPRMPAGVQTMRISPEDPRGCDRVFSILSLRKHIPHRSGVGVLAVFGLVPEPQAVRIASLTACILGGREAWCSTTPTTTRSGTTPTGSASFFVDFARP